MRSPIDSRPCRTLERALIERRVHQLEDADVQRRMEAAAEARPPALYVPPGTLKQ